MNFWNDPLKVAADWLLGIFTGWGMPEIAAQILIGFIGILLLITLLMVLDIFLVWVERKVVSRFQDRIGRGALLRRRAKRSRCLSGAARAGEEARTSGDWFPPRCRCAGVRGNWASLRRSSAPRAACKSLKAVARGVSWQIRSSGLKCPAATAGLAAHDAPAAQLDSSKRHVLLLLLSGPDDPADFMVLDEPNSDQQPQPHEARTLPAHPPLPADCD
jgi:hypothetical protein